MRLLLSIFLLLVWVDGRASYPQVDIKTSQGPIRVELYPDKAPKTVENFLNYVKSGFYKGTIFHRVVNHFVIQGGGFTAELKPKDTLPAIPSEATNGLNNDAGMLAMARAYDPNSATSQFFINVERNLFLNHYKPHPDYYGYTVFGKVIQGMDIVEKIAAMPTTTAGPYFTDVPITPIEINDITVVPEMITEEPVAPKKNRAKIKKANKIKKSKH